uniref:Cocaine- and amphetamine-regulated transcript protein n=1 Tax=Poecilia latipinna TaxID=48699 RepID=A0A3B3VKW8_9TELE
MHVERKWHILLTIFFLLISSGQCMDSKEVKQNERRTLLDLILQVIKDSQQRDKPVSRHCGSGLHTSAQDFKSSSREKPLYVPRLDNTRLIAVRLVKEKALILRALQMMKQTCGRKCPDQIKPDAFSPACKIICAAKKLTLHVPLITPAIRSGGGSIMLCFFVSWGGGGGGAGGGGEGERIKKK